MTENFSDKELGRLIQRTLLAGVFLSLFFLFIGFAFRLSGLSGSDAVIRAGILLLVFTPVARVAMLVYGYWRKKEYHFALASFVVLALLSVSILF